MFFSNGTAFVVTFTSIFLEIRLFMQYFYESLNLSCACLQQIFSLYLSNCTIFLYVSWIELLKGFGPTELGSVPQSTIWTYCRSNALRRLKPFPDALCSH